MRAVTLVLFVVIAGCDRTTLQTVETVVAPNGKERLIRKDWETVSFSNSEEMSYDSHSLVWQRLNGDNWADYVTIAQDDFQRGCPNRRWIDSIDSFDPKTGIAVLKIAEGTVPENSGFISYIYSWREWDLKANKEVKTIRVCSDPFEPFEKTDVP